MGRWLIDRFGCHVVCVDVSHAACERNTYLTEQAGLMEQMTILERSFTETGCLSESVDLVVSQDSFLHAGRDVLPLVLQEAHRVLRKGGYLAFTDIVENDDTMETTMQKGTETARSTTMHGVYGRLGLSSMATRRGYLALAEKEGFLLCHHDVSSDAIFHHYNAILKLLRSSDVQLNAEFRKRMEEGLLNWIAAAKDDFVQHATFVFCKT